MVREVARPLLRPFPVTFHAGRVRLGSEEYSPWIDLAPVDAAGPRVLEGKTLQRRARPIDRHGRIGRPGRAPREARVLHPSAPRRPWRPGTPQRRGERYGIRSDRNHEARELSVGEDSHPLGFEDPCPVIRKP